MNRNAKRGAYYKARTRRWLLGLGWQIADLEIIRWVYTPRGRLPVKRDQFGSDLLAMSGSRIVFVQVKSGNVGGTFPEARRKFAEFQWAPSAEKWIVAWKPRARQPRIVNVK